jgi:hypothetical protein
MGFGMRIAPLLLFIVRRTVDMDKSQLHFKSLLALTLAIPLWLGTAVSGQNVNPQYSAPPQGQDNNPYNNNDITRQELADFNQFLLNHPEVAEQLRKDPSLVDNREFIESHTALQTYLQDHPRIREEIKANPNAFMRNEDRYDRRNDDITRRELADFNQFLDKHPEIAEQLRKDPSLVDNRQFVTDHPALQAYFEEHPRIRAEIKDHPDIFMRAEDRFEQRGDRRDDINRGELTRFNQFLEGHPEIAEQLRKDPALVDNRQFVMDHPALQTYLQEHPAIRAEIKEYPDAFMRDEDRYDRYASNRGNSNGGARDERVSFGEFLGVHSNIADELSKDPSLLKNQEYMTNHPELQTYLNAHPAAQAEMTQNPESFIRSAQQFKSGAGMKSPMPDPTKPKQ